MAKKFELFKGFFTFFFFFGGFPLLVLILGEFTMKSMERSKRRKKEAPHVEASVNSKEFDPRQLFTPHVQIPGIAPKYQSMYSSFKLMYQKRD